MRFVKWPEFANRWMWLCPILAVALAAAVLWSFGFSWWSALLAALMLVPTSASGQSLSAFLEAASAALRRAEPELESWVNPPSATLRKPRPVWLLIGALWLSTALVTLGAAFAISVLVG